MLGLAQVRNLRLFRGLSIRRCGPASNVDDTNGMGHEVDPKDDSILADAATKGILPR
jgi:hypothetical protein